MKSLSVRSHRQTDRDGFCDPENQFKTACRKVAGYFVSRLRLCESKVKTNSSFEGAYSIVPFYI